MSQSTAAAQAARDETVRLWEWLCAHDDADLKGKSAEHIGAALNMSRSQTHKRLQIFVQLGMMQLKLSYEWQRTIPNWQKLVSEDQGKRRIADYFAKGGVIYKKKVRKAKVVAVAPERPVDTEKVAIRQNGHGEPVEAIVGDEPPKPFEALAPLRRNEGAALVEAARQYAERNDAIVQKFTELESLGIRIDREKAMRAIHLDRDERLEAIGDLLPYIESLEQHWEQVGKMQDIIVGLRGRVRTAESEISRLSNELRRQQEANKRLADKLVARPVPPVPAMTRPE